MSKTFKIIYNLEGLDDSAIEQYKADVSQYFGLDPAMNWFDVLWMTDPDTSLRRRQLYARRGTTDVLRDKRKISIIEMVQHDGPGYVSFTAKGENGEGRREVAVGAHSTEGLSGEKLAAAVATAETRAGRRLTLKFCGLGILDYTEVTDPVEVKASPANLAPLSTAPMFAPTAFPIPNAAPGTMVDPKTRALDNTVAEAKAEGDEIARKALEAVQAFKGSLPTTVAQQALSVPPPTPEQAKVAEIHDAQEKIVVRDDGVTIPVPPGVSMVTDTAPVKTRRKRQKNTVTVGQVSDAPSPAPTGEGGTVGNGSKEVPPLTEKTPPIETPEQYAERMRLEYERAKQFLANRDATDVGAAPARVADGPAQPVPVVSSPAPNLSTPHQPILAPPQPAPIVDFPGKPTKEQEDQYREAMRQYSNVILPGAGMVPSPGIGGPSAKLRMYAERMAGKPTQQMTVDDWNDFFTGMEAFRKTNGDKGLVKYMNDVIGAK